MGSVFGLKAPAGVESGRLTAFAGPMIAGIVAGLLPGQVLVAQETNGADEGVHIEQIVVTARRREESLQDVPVSITAFSSEALERNMFEGVTDYLSRAPNVNFISNGSRDRKEISVRGVSSQGGSAATFGFYLDGFSVGNVTHNPAVMDLERIEVLRGPQGTYFGRNSVGGAINITTKKPVQEWFGQLTADFSRFATYDVEGIGNMPLIEDKLAARVAVKYHESDGYIQNINALGGGNDSEYKYGRLSLRYTPTDRLTIDLAGAYSDEIVGMREGVPSGVMSLFAASLFGPVADPDGVGFFPENTDRVNFNRPQDVGVEYQYLVGNVEYAFDGFTVTSVTGYIDSDPFLRGDIDGGSIDYFYEQIASTASSASQEIRLQSTDGGPLDWTVGAIVGRDRSGHDQHTFVGDAEIFGFPADFELNSDQGKSEVLSRALFGEAVWHFNERLRLLLGLRYTYETVENFSFHVSNGVINDLLSGKTDFDDVSPKVSLSYDFGDDTTVYGTVSKGFKAGGVQIGSNLTDASYDPEQLWNYEVGLKSEFFDGRARFNAAVFYMDWKDLQASFRVSSNVDGVIEFFSGIQNVASATNLGAEAELTTVLTDNLIASLGVGYVHAEFDDFDNAFVLGETYDLSGRQIPQSPRWTMNGDVEYLVPFRNYDGYVRLEWHYRDEIRSSLDSLVREDEGFPFVVPSYHHVNLRAGVDGERFSVAAYVENLLDEDYFTNAYRKAFMSGLFLEPSYQTYGVRVTMRTE